MARDQWKHILYSRECEGDLLVRRSKRVCEVVIKGEGQGGRSDMDHGEDTKFQKIVSQSCEAD